MGGGGSGVGWGVLGLGVINERLSIPDNPDSTMLAQTLR